MKRSLHDYPDFSALYGELNELFYERVISRVPREIWTHILELLHRRDRSIRYCHTWVQWTLVSKTFHKAVYGMAQIFINVQLFPDVNPSPILSRFSNLKHLTLPCFTGELLLPKLEKLEKLKIRYSEWTHCSPVANSECGEKHDFSEILEENLPSLKYFSFRHSCVEKDDILKLPQKLRERMTKASLNNLLLWWGDLETLFPKAVFIKSQSSGFRMNDSYASQLQEIHCLHDQFLRGFTGHCRFYFGSYSGSTTRDYIAGSIVGGKRVGEWLSYEKSLSSGKIKVEELK